MRIRTSLLVQVRNAMTIDDGYNSDIYLKEMSYLQVGRVYSVDTAGNDRLEVHILVDAVLAALAAHTGMLNTTKPAKLLVP